MDSTACSTVMLYTYYGDLGSIPNTAPPMLVLHGSKDPLVPVEAARGFVQLRRTRSTVVYGDFPAMATTSTSSPRRARTA